MAALAADTGRWLEGDPNVYRLSAGNTAVDPAGLISCQAFAAASSAGSEPFANLNALYRIDAHTGRRQVSIELRIYRSAPASRHAGCNAFDDRPEAVAAGSRLVEHRFPAALVALAADLDHAGGNVHFRDHQARHCTARDAHRRFAG